jgi:hypothetical protein
MLLSLLLLVPVVLPLGEGGWRLWQAHKQMAGDWFGLSPIGLVKVEFESTGAVVLYPKRIGQQPWIARWRVHELWHGDSEVRMQLSETDDSVYSASGVPSADDAALHFDPSYFDLLAANKRASPLPLHLQRVAPDSAVDFYGMDDRVAFTCSSGPSGYLLLNGDGSGQLQLDAYDGVTAGAWPVFWANFSQPQSQAGLRFVVAQPWPNSLQLLSGHLAQRGNYQQLRYTSSRQGHEIICQVALLR